MYMNIIRLYFQNALFIIARHLLWAQNIYYLVKIVLINFSCILSSYNLDGLSVNCDKCPQGHSQRIHANK